MNTSTHGHSRLFHYANYNITADLKANAPLTGFLLGTNIPVGHKPLPIGSNITAMAGEAITWNGDRLDSPDFGTVWVPGRTPGMALTFGSAGSGKGGLLIPAALTYSGNLVINDPKGELMWITGERRRSYGMKVANADPFGEVQRGYADLAGKREPAMRYNPLAALYPNDPEFAMRIATIAEALAIDKDERGNIFNGTGRDFIEGCIMAEATRFPGRATLRGVRSWMNYSDTELATAVTGFVAEYPDSLAASKLRLFSDMTSRTNQSTRITAKEQTKFLDNPQICAYFEPGDGEPTFSMDELARGRLTVYIVLPGYLLGSYSGFSRLLFNQALEAVQRLRANPELPVTFLMDEAGTSIGRMDSVEQAYGLARGAGMVLWSFYQDLAQIQRDYSKSWNTFLANSACITVTGARDNLTCDYFSDLLGTWTQDVTTTGSNTGQSSSGHSSGTSVTMSQAARKVMLPDEIRTMGADNMLVLMPGSMGNFLQGKIRYHRDYRFNGRYRHDPHFPAGNPEPYPRGPYELPTIGPEGPASKSRKVPLMVSAAAVLLTWIVASGSAAMLVAIVAGLYLWLAAGKPEKPTRGDWRIGNHIASDTLGAIYGY